MKDRILSVDRLLENQPSSGAVGIESGRSFNLLTLNLGRDFKIDNCVSSFERKQYLKYAKLQFIIKLFVAHLFRTR